MKIKEALKEITVLTSEIVKEKNEHKIDLKERKINILKDFIYLKQEIKERKNSVYQNTTRENYKYSCLLLELSLQSNDIQLGRKIQNFSDEIWDKHKIDIVTQANYLKFTQNPELLKIMLEYRDLTLVEDSLQDKIWVQAFILMMNGFLMKVNGQVKIFWVFV